MIKRKKTVARLRNAIEAEHVPFFQAYFCHIASALSLYQSYLNLRLSIFLTLKIHHAPLSRFSDVAATPKFNITSSDRSSAAI